MMKKFLGEDFLLDNDTAKELFFHAGKMPIIDYHCHLNPEEIALDRRYDNISQVWLGADHYKWRAMRGCGIDEKLITGDADDYDKFRAWASVVPYLIGNPLFHWTYLELKRYFDIDKEICPQNAKYIWDATNEKISSPDFSARGLIKKSNVELICTTDDPFDSLEYHAALAKDDSFATRVLPAFRTDNLINIHKDTFIPYMNKIKGAMGKAPSDIKELKEMLLKRIEFFDSLGCRFADQSVDTVPYSPCDEKAADLIFRKKLNGEKLTSYEVDCYRTHMMLFLGEEYAKKNWVMQLHMSVMRNNNSLMFSKIGADTGFDSINDPDVAQPLSRLLDALAVKELLPKTVLYALNPKDNYVLCSMLGNFQAKGEISKMQFGSAWWFNDHKDGMELQLKTLANMGVLSKFIGMLTDSRSFLSYTRHEYFRRILCNVMGTWVENGEYPYNRELLIKMAEDISYRNIKKYME